MGEKPSKEVQHFMLKQYRRYAPLLDKYQWPWEIARWHELVFCLLVRLDDSSLGIARARQTVNIFAILHLLEIDALANIISEKGEPDLHKPETALIMGILERQGYGNTKAEGLLVTICEAARALRQRFDGKVQKYLRKYGKLMINEFSNDFSFSRMSEEDVKHVLVNWLQNVLNMPVALSNPSVKTLCEKLGIEIEGLVDIADTNDINVAVMDDWAADYIQHEKLEGTS